VLSSLQDGITLLQRGSLPLLRHIVLHTVAHFSPAVSSLARLLEKLPGMLLVMRPQKNRVDQLNIGMTERATSTLPVPL
jgi:hypothetical protein